MSPTHANKKGVRYRYYVSHALLQGRTGDAGSTPRVAAADVETAVLDAVRSDLANTPVSNVPDRELIQNCVKQLTIHSDYILLELNYSAGSEEASKMIAFSPYSKPRKGIAYSAAASDRITDQTRDTLLAAILRSRDWVDAILMGQRSSFAQIAENEKLAERHVRFLAPLAYLSPRLIEAIAEGRAPADLTVSRLARNLPTAWNDQERRFHL
jgi:hypothetical protein